MEGRQHKCHMWVRAKTKERRQFCITVISKVSSLNLQILLIEGIDNDQGYVRTYYCKKLP
jgi:hypothetical protein